MVAKMEQGCVTVLKETSKSVAAALAVLLIAFIAPAIARDSIPDRLFPGTRPPDRLPEPRAARPSHDKLVVPPGEEPYYPVREDGQPYVLNVDKTVNLTESLNAFYYDPKWRGEVWVPFDQVSNIERATRLMATWPEYDQANMYRKFTHVNKFLERMSGFGP